MIVRSIEAAYGAFLDRKAVTLMHHKSLNGIDLQYYNKLVETSGPSVHKPNKVIKSFIKAYKHQVAKLKMEESINAQFATPSTTKKIAKALIKGIVKPFTKQKPKSFIM